MARQRAVFPRDTGLQVRVVFTLFLLGLLYVALVGALLAAGTGLIPIVVIIGALSFAQLFFSDRLALAAMGAKEVSPEEAPGLHAMIERLCIQADLPKPKIAVADTQMPNAFATGRSQKSATVCATTGIMNTLSPSELEGVMAHELAHVKNRDVLISTIAATLAGAITYLAHMAQWSAMFGGRHSDDDEGGTNPIAAIAMAIVAPIAARLVQMAVSRAREYQADATGAAIAGKTWGLEKALEKLHMAQHAVPMHANPATAHMFIVNPLTGRNFATLFSTHPPLEDRIARLRAMRGTAARV